MPTKVLVIGLDAAEATLIEKWAKEGILPTFERLRLMSHVYELDNCMRTLPGAIWPEIISGRSSGKMGIFFHPAQLHTGEAALRPIQESELNADEYFWSVASQAGKRIAVIDQPQAAIAKNFNGIQIMEWGLHDRPFHVRSSPAPLLEDVYKRYGKHLPHQGMNRCDNHGQTVEGYRKLLGDLIDGAERKNQLLLDFLNNSEWDLFVAGYGESHCVGHQFWRFLAQDEEDSSSEFCDAIRLVYSRIDSGVGALLDSVDRETTCLIFTSHGMGPYIAGYQLLKEFLVRLGLGSATKESPAIRRFRWAQDRINRFAPRKLYPVLHKLVRNPVVKNIQSKAGSLVNPLESPHTKAITLRNNRCGAIRLNIIGREPHGCINPGVEAEELIAFIKDELLSLRDPNTEQCIVRQIVTAQEAFGPDHHPDVPDIMVDFRTDLGTLEACRSKRVGLIKTPRFHNQLPRTGDHTSVSRLWISGPNIVPSSDRYSGNVLDIAPTVLSLLGIKPPDFIDGKPLV